MFIITVLLTVPLLVLVLLPTGDGVCTMPPDIIVWNEQKPKGSLLFNVSKTAADTVSFVISNKTNLKPNYQGELKNYFNLTTGEGWYALTLVEMLDLERFYRIWRYEVVIANQEINEYTPTFIHGPYITTVSELATVGTKIYDFNGKAEDGDIPKARLFFSISDYIIKEYDGNDFFEMFAFDGIVVLRKQIDFDVLTHNFFILNISVQDAFDGTQRRAFTTLNITVLDEDDQNLVFSYPGCSGSSCIVPSYEAMTGLAETGLLNVTPPIRVTDRDSLKTPMQFSILSGDVSGLFKIDPDTGAITQLKSVLQEHLTNTEFRLVIKVTKQNTVCLSALAILTVRVRERTPILVG